MTSGTAHEVLCPKLTGECAEQQAGRRPRGSRWGGVVGADCAKKRVLRELDQLHLGVAIRESADVQAALPMMLRALGGAAGVALLGEYLARHAADGLISALVSVFTAAALAVLPVCAAAWALPARLAPVAAPRPTTA